MNGWTCPDCGGGFPSPVETDHGLECPWCSENINAHWERDDPITSNMLSDGGDDAPDNPLGGLLK
jgi:hypothetical protein